MSWLIDYLEEVLLWLLELVLWLPLKFYEILCDGLILVLENIPVPAWLADAGDVTSGIPAGVAYFLIAAELPLGLAIIGSAYAIRFVIRRIPIFG